MTVSPIGEADAPLRASVPAPAGNPHAAFGAALEHAFGAAGDALARADAAEGAFVRGRGGLQEMVLERAQADVALSIASAATSRVAQSLQTILGMQV